MAAVSFGHRKYIRPWPILILLSVALLLVLRNLQNLQIRLGLSVYDYLDCFELQRQDSPRTRDLQRLVKCRNRPLRFQRLQHGEFWLLQNLVIGRKSSQVGCTESITYTTNGDYTFFDNLETVVERWGGPVSFAIHAPGYDLNATLDAIQYVRNCLPGSEAISDWVSFHVYFSNQHMPENVPYDEDEVLARPYVCTMADGFLIPPPYTLIDRSDSYKVKANLTYPINVGRNIARQAANTHFIFACDIELYPSLGFVDQFLDMVSQNHSVLALDPSQPRRVYPLAVFEIEARAQIPKNKAELMDLYRKKQAQIFHLKLCSTCHEIPGQQDWLNRTPSIKDHLQLFSMGRREYKFKFWEPFYVSDKTEPLFDERVSWEGQSDKRTQNYDMCLLGYEYYALHPAFLVHSPGIKKLAKTSSNRLKYVEEMNKFIKFKIEPEYRVLYGRNAACTT
ncbi:beta-1,4-glucuronyltransferase 1-like [Drosophila kikkawai]|uniref:Beta-1,4-glucuronyltransferase 1-like n=1 Tax=Drosophila kikkawai TaxID=30033 RepID=A0A6P4HWZ8_DROKI|nr:beta-1,4-glucuronyltransferase 1-like [Drosophila kikkawai]